MMLGKEQIIGGWFSLANTIVPIAVGWFYGLMASRKKQFDWLAVIFSPALSALIILTGTILSGMLGLFPNPLRESNSFSNSVTGASSVMSDVFLNCIPIAVIVCIIAQLLWLKGASKARS